MGEEQVSLTTSAGPMGAFVAIPDDASRAPAVVVAQEAFGVNHHIREVCRRFAAAGYVALAPELFHRSGAAIEIPYGDMPPAMEQLRALTNEGLEEDLAAALAHLRARAHVDAARVGLVGFCVGGFAAYLGACRLDPAATVSFYGGGVARPRPQFELRPILDESPSIRRPMLCLFGAEDQGITSEDVNAIRAQLDRLATPHEVVVYPDAGHAFFCDARPAYRAGPAADAWTRTLDWLARHLAGAARAV